MFLDTQTQAPPTAPKTLEPWRQLLLDAATLIETKGHCKGAFESNDGRHCAVGAIYSASGVPFLSVAIVMDSFGLPVKEARSRLIRSLSSDASITAWNDAPERTPTEVVTKLRNVANSE